MSGDELGDKFGAGVGTARSGAASEVQDFAGALDASARATIGRVELRRASRGGAGAFRSVTTRVLPAPTAAPRARRSPFEEPLDWREAEEEIAIEAMKAAGCDDVPVPEPRGIYRE